MLRNTTVEDEFDVLYDKLGIFNYEKTGIVIYRLQTVPYRGANSF